LYKRPQFLGKNFVKMFSSLKDILVFPFITEPLFKSQKVFSYTMENTVNSFTDYKDWLRSRVSGQLVSSQYFRQAMAAFREKYRSNTTEVLFVMASDDIDWCQTMFSNETDVVFASAASQKYDVKQPTFDLAVLSLCHHSIIR